MINWFIVFSLLFGLLGITQPVSTPRTPPPPKQGIEVQLDQPFDLPFSVTADIPGVANLNFTGIEEDSRCPKDVMCAWSGMVVVRVEAQASDQPAQTLRLGAFTDQEGTVSGPVPGKATTPKATVQGAGGDVYLVQLLAAKPYPAKANAKTADADYTLTLKVSKAGTQGGTAQPTPTPAPMSQPPPGETNLPVVCTSEKAVTEWAAGASKEAPIKLSEAVDATQLDGKDGLDAFCSQRFGEGWHAAEQGDQQDWWGKFLESETKVWLWDNNAGQPVEAEL